MPRIDNNPPSIIREIPVSKPASRAPAASSSSPSKPASRAPAASPSSPSKPASRAPAASPSSPSKPSVAASDAFSKDSAEGVKNASVAATGSAQAFRAPKAPSATIKIDTAYVGEVGPKDYLSADGTFVRPVLNKDYNPVTTTQRVVLRDKTLFAYLREIDPGGVGGYDVNYEITRPQHLETMDRKEVREHIEKWVASDVGQAALSELDITDVQNLTPKQAMLFSSRLASSSMKYHKAAWEQSSPSVFTKRALQLQKELDATPLEDLLGGKAKGLCRTFAEVTQGVFEVVKTMQTPETSLLRNTYAKTQDGYQHHWLAFYTAQADGTVMVSQTDSTWNSKSTSAYGLDFTFGNDDVRDYYRMNTLLRDTGFQVVESFARSLDPDLADWPLAGMDSSLDSDAFEVAGGLLKLNDILSAMPKPAQMRAGRLFDPGALAEIQAYRAANGLALLPTGHPDRNK